VIRMRFTGMSLWELYTFGPPAETIGAYVAADAPDAASTDVWTVMPTAPDLLLAGSRAAGERGNRGGTT
jgi:hypothetical protein